MTFEEPLSILFLWHQHQPLYKDTLANRYEMPWVRLHATKDYYDMAALLEEFPNIRVNINLVPSLLIQLDDYAQHGAQDFFIDLTLKPASQLSFEDRLFILENFFMANWETMIDPHPRYRELLDKRGRGASKETYARSQTYFKEQDWRDLQMWFNLAWFDPWWREKDPTIAQWIAKGRGFLEEEKKAVVAKQREICGLVTAKHKQLQDRGQIEITTTPFYHPILPLLCDSEAARVAMPHVTLPNHRFQHSEDAQEQLRRATADYEKRFGHAPAGLWPSEGSVSETTAKLISDAGIRWVATDEGILARSLTTQPFDRDAIYQAYRYNLGDKHIHFFFRDHDLSDAIGFVYSSWNPEDAAQDFIKRLHDIKNRLRSKEGGRLQIPHVVSVILDGENCWEYYRDDGLPFLRALYKRLSQDAELKTVRASDYLAQHSESRLLPKIWSGSWINSNFAIWIGHPEDNKAWDLLNRTRTFLEHHLDSHPDIAKSISVQQAWEEIYVAEGSDWCWWYGEDHSSANDEMFDYLFRKHLMNVYSILGLKIPEDLHVPIKIKRQKLQIHPPVDFITPTIDGRVTNYFEWQAAGYYHTDAGATGTMHRSQNIVKSIYYGFDKENLYFRIDLTRLPSPEALTSLKLKIIFINPENYEITAKFEGNQNIDLQMNSADNALSLTPGRLNKIIELQVPLNKLPALNMQEFELFIAIFKDETEQERWPSDNTLKFPYPTENAFADNWVI